MMAFDPRLTPARPELAARHLEGVVAATRFVEGKTYEVIEPQAPVRRAPAPDAALLTEALMGERVVVYEANDEGWAWGQLQADDYVGWLPLAALAEAGAVPTDKVTALRTLMFPGPNIKLPPLAGLPLGARLAIVRHERSFAVTAAGGHVPAQHLAPIDTIEPDFVTVAKRFLGVPYLWGGKTSLGIDCSGLVQVALTACGIPCPRDSDMQERALGTPVVADRDFSNLRRGDLIFWPGHVAIMRDPTTIIHANAHRMAVTVEPVSDAIARIRTTGCEVSNSKRLQ
jgi:cell wall-associated NlpC family hydrolase